MSKNITLGELKEMINGITESGVPDNTIIKFEGSFVPSAGLDDVYVSGSYIGHYFDDEAPFDVKTLIVQLEGDCIEEWML